MMNKIVLSKEYDLPENLEFYILLELLEYEKGRRDQLTLINTISVRNNLNIQTVVSLLYKFLETKKEKVLENLPSKFYMRFKNVKGR